MLFHTIIIIKMAEEIDFKIDHFRKFDGPVTLTLSSDNLESHIFENDLTPAIASIGLWLHWVWLWTDGRTDVRTDGQTDGRMDGHLFTNSMSHGCVWEVLSSWAPWSTTWTLCLVINLKGCTDTYNFWLLHARQISNHWPWNADVFTYQVNSPC